MFCPECGTKLDNDVIFCPECGTKVSSYTIKETNSQNNYIIKGLILTHIPRLASKLHTSEEWVELQIKRFIDLKSLNGFTYQLVDAGNCNNNIINSLFGRKRDIGKNAQWYEYADLLREIHDNEIRKKESESIFLFIIGGDDIIPMPSIPHYLGENAPDKDQHIDTDLLYAYPYGEKMNEAICTGELFHYDALFYVGRLPLATDASANDLSDYLERAAQNPIININEAYGQCDPHWMKVSTIVTKDLSSSGLFPKYKPIPKDYLYNNLFLTPKVDERLINNIFNREAQIIFFNLHGGNALNGPNFYGESMTEKVYYTAIRPEDIKLCKYPNIIVTEACYGARFIGFDKAHSMLLTALSSETLLYLGSSRIAYGAIDTQNSQQSTTILNADIMAYVFINNLLSGLPAGAALFEARRCLLDNGEFGVYEAITAVEFNLFGDPSLFVGSTIYKNSKLIQSPCQNGPITNKNNFTRIANEPLKTGLSSAQQSLLNKIRAQVDSNLNYIQNIIGKRLYEQWGIEPRLSHVSKLTYSNGEKGWNFQYEIDEPQNSSKDIFNILSVTTDINGKIRNVTVSR